MRGSRRGHVDTYAFLDEVSDTSICSQGLADRLKLKGQSIRFNLSTVNGTETQRGKRFNLSVKGINDNFVLSLPNVISVMELPELRSSIPTSDDVARYNDVL